MSLADLQERIREGVRKELPFALLTRCIEKHERMGFRTDCACDYCQAKRAGTRRIRFSTEEINKALYRGTWILATRGVEKTVVCCFLSSGVLRFALYEKS